ncbi:MAG: hypothetical protein ACLTV6_08325 [Christensenellales bacterium]
MKATLDALDERLHGLLTRPCGRAARIVCAALTAFGFALVMATRTLALGHPMATAAALCVPLAAMLIFAMRIVKEHEQGVLGALLLCALCAAAMLARVSFLERSSGDYDIYLADWLQKLAGGSFAEGMRQNIGEYNVLYQYILFIITRLSVPSLYAVKAVSFIGDAFLAGAAAALAQKDGKKSMAAFGLALLLPTIVLNGGMFAQCDSVRGLCAVGTGACAGRKAARGGEFALSLAFAASCVHPAYRRRAVGGQELRLSDALVFWRARADGAARAAGRQEHRRAAFHLHGADAAVYGADLQRAELLCADEYDRAGRVCLR